ncbi:MAG: thiamine diphosphokinase [Candidatus Marinimicrobia bacterium]|nr:thiamine diphosphokinase [Candidatus Neomarinimicrobiota bacterium]MCF7841075.1 thiamine diphosphokinase [Candidatus Neomarinimicrobiota bacterium]
MRILIILGGPPPQPARLQHHAQEADRIIAADGGAMACLNAGVTPHLVIGDLDSVTLETIPENWVVQKDSNQDTTDFQKVFGVLTTSKINRLMILGGLGGRVDHELTNLHIAAALDPSWEVEFEGINAHIFRVINRMTIALPVNSTLSLIPWPEALIEKTTGLQWDLTNTLLSPNSQLGQSNRVTHSPVTIRLNHGMLYAVQVLNHA